MSETYSLTQDMSLILTTDQLGLKVVGVLLTFLSTRITSFAVVISSPELFAVYLPVFYTCIGQSKISPLKTAAAIMIGFGIAAVGMGTVSGEQRLTFD